MSGEGLPASLGQSRISTWGFRLPPWLGGAKAGRPTHKKPPTFQKILNFGRQRSLSFPPAHNGRGFPGSVPCTWPTPVGGRTPSRGLPRAQSTVLHVPNPSPCEACVPETWGDVRQLAGGGSTAKVPDAQLMPVRPFPGAAPARAEASTRPSEGWTLAGASPVSAWTTDNRCSMSGPTRPHTA